MLSERDLLHTDPPLQRMHAEHRCRELVDSVPAIVWRGNAATLQFTFVSKQAVAILGYPLEEWTTEPLFWNVHLHAEDRERAVSVRRQAILEKRSRQLEYRMIAADGRTVWLDDVVNVIVENEEPKELAGVMVDITPRKEIEAEREALHRRILASREQLQVLSRRLLRAQEDERRRLAGELHDEIGQILTAVSLSLELTKATVGEADCGHLDESMAVVDRAIEQVRTMSLNLRPAMLDVLGLESALRWFVDRQVRTTGIAIDLVSSLGERVSQELETACFRIVQESLTNVVRHAHAQHVRIELTRAGDELLLSLQDDGAGFDATAARQRATTGGSLGLLGMEERTRLLGGSFEIDSAIGRGTTVRVRLPST
jgi:PAS domain S-box-containing protein